jgi:hypothetical protein
LDFRREFSIYPILHVTIPLLTIEIPYVKNKNKIDRASLLIGSLIPDIIDKLIMFLNLGSGRGYFHTLLSILISFAFTLIITKGNKEVSLSLLIGMGFHLILDLPYIPLLYPFIPYEFIIVEDPLGVWLKRLLTNPLIIISESIGLLIIIFVILNNKIFSVSDIINYLKSNPKTLIEKDTDNSQKKKVFQINRW